MLLILSLSSCLYSPRNFYTRQRPRGPNVLLCFFFFFLLFFWHLEMRYQSRLFDATALARIIRALARKAVGEDRKKKIEAHRGRIITGTIKRKKNDGAIFLIKEKCERRAEAKSKTGRRSCEKKEARYDKLKVAFVNYRLCVDFFSQEITWLKFCEFIPRAAATALCS